MSDEMLTGIVAGAGWGLFLGFIIGASWFARFLSEWGDDEQRQDQDQERDE